MGTGANVESIAQCNSVTEVWFGWGIFEIMDKTSEKFTSLTCLEQNKSSHKCLSRIIMR